MNELELLKNKIKYRASYRGTKEMDILLTSFVNSIINNLEHLELLKLDEFLNLNDEEIYNYYLNGRSISLFNDQKILNLFKNFKM
jgi:antitoxin CptB|tara:strand:- start:45 stop:299 length:255 start_codon:yes stop_codon:yes gene_type:complete